MKIRYLLIVLVTMICLSGYGQYLSNPSMEGTILMIGPPPGWAICIVGSTPNVQPGKYAVYLPPSDGITYVGLLTRPNNTWEDMHAHLDVPLSKDSCYQFKIDLAFWEYLSFTVVDPVVVKVYGGNVDCQKNNLLWQSPPIANEDWLTYEFLIHSQDSDINDIILEAYFAGSVPYYGYVLLDNIRINPTPEVDIGNDTTLTLCGNDSIILDAGPGFASYLWQDGSTNSTYVVTTAGTYWVKVFTAQGCSASDTVNITIEEYLEMETIMMDSIYSCKEQEINMWVNVNYGVPPYTYTWNGLPDTTSNVTIIADSTTFYVVTITDKCGNQISDSLKVIVLPGPDIDLGNDTLICIDGSYTLHAGGGYASYTWQDGSHDSTLTIYNPGIYWVEVTSSIGCVSRDTIQIQLFPAIQLNIGNDTTLCLGQSVSLNAGSGFSSYLWQNYSTDSLFTAYTTGWYWVMVTDMNGCNATDSVYISFLSTPEIDLGNDTSACQGINFVLNAGAGYISYLWQNGETGQYFTVTQSGTYSVTVDNGCGVASDTIMVIVYPSPEPDLGNDTTICAGQSITLEPGNQFLSYQWQDNSAFPFFIVTNSGVYSVEVENIFGCKATDEIYIGVSDPQVNLGQDTHLCDGDSLVLDAGSGFVSYLWLNDLTSQTQTVLSGGTFGVTVTDQFGCMGNDEIEIVLYPYPFADLGGDKVICTGDVLFLMAPEGNFKYYWNGQPGGQTFAITSSGYYTLSVVNPCDSVSDGIQVNENPVPTVYLGEDKVIFPGETIELDAGEGYDSYLWQDGSGLRFFVVTENNINPDNPYYFVEVTEGFCKNADTIKIELFRVWVPKVITPNGDGQNDVFMPDPQRWQGIKHHNMVVLNRWGEKVWESNDFPSGWDGKLNGNYVADGTYFWVLEVYYGNDDVKQTMKGSLTVLGTSH